MENFYRPEDIRQADVTASLEYGVPSILLMENAARGAVCEAVKIAKDSDKFVLLAGCGNNGGDAFAAARLLAICGKEAVVIKTDGDEKYKNDAAVNLGLLRRFAMPSVKIFDSERLEDAKIAELYAGAGCVVDGLLGTGTRGAPRKEAARLIGLLKGRAGVLALDIPSGIDPVTGEVYQPCVRAEATVTFLAAKTGMALFPAAQMCGRIITAHIGVPKDKVLPDAPELRVYFPSDLRGMLPEMPQDVHKTRRGSLLIFSGSEKYKGAPLLVARGALRAGAGIVYLAVPDFIAPHAASELPEAIVVALPTTEDGKINAQEAIRLFGELSLVCTAAAAGPGCGRGAECGEIFSWLWNEWKKPLLLDADMLFFFAEDGRNLTPRRDALITPHGGEAARILQTTPDAVEASRLDSVRRMVVKAGAALLKGRRTLIASEGPVRAVCAGSPALAVPGSGDVLTGVAGAFMAAGMAPAEAACAAALAHGTAGERLFQKYGARGALATEIADEIPYSLR
ncbi:MAG: NAD(P)H-hydrate dehydratase [Cloacibacillus sp.]